MEKISTERLAGWGEESARSIPVNRTVSGRRAAARLGRTMAEISAKAKDPGQSEWFADNEYLARREAELAMAALRAGGRIRRCRDGAALVKLCRRLVKAGPVTEQRVAAFLTGARRQTELPENEAALVGAALRAALLEELAEPDTDGAAAAELFGSLRTVADMDLTDALESSDPVDRLLRQDGVYPAMDEASRAQYRARIQRLAKKQGVPALETAQAALDGGLHEYLFPPNRRTGAGYVAARVALPGALAVLAGVLTGSLWTALLALLPLTELTRVGLDGALLRLVRPRRLPRLALDKGVGRDGRTVCAVSALLADDVTGPRLVRRLEEYRLASRDCGEELVFALLADLPDSPQLPSTAEGRLEPVRAAVEVLNEKYGGGFFLLTRELSWNRADRVYAPWERKRGAILELARRVQGRPNRLKCLAGDEAALFARYILCLDADTRLAPGAARQLIGAAMHPLQTPAVERGVVVRGHGVLHPRMAVELDRAMATDFARIYAGQGGTDPYGAPTGELFTDLYDRGGFAGKGVVDAAAYLACLDGRFGDGRVLSHDALEGAYLRGAYVGDVELADGSPVTAAAWFRRLHRWTRGDWQNLPWLFGAGRDLPMLERFRLLDSLRRSMVAPAALLALVLGMLSAPFRPAALLALICLGAEAVQDAFAGLFARRSDARLRCRSGVLRGLGGSLTRLFARLILLPWEGYTCASAACTALWRMGVSHRNMLQWVPAAQAEKGRELPAAVWFDLALGLALTAFAPGPGGKAAGVVWLGAPLFARLTGREQTAQNGLTDGDRSFLRKSAGAIWGYFADLCVRSDHWLPPDNLQVQPPKGAAHRTSPTNIGLALTAALAAMELGAAAEGDAAALAEHILTTVEKLPKWRGHLYNWYDTRTCAPLQPAYVSAVDSGNLCACLYTFSAGMAAHGRHDLAERARVLADETDLGALYDEKKRLFRIGLDPTSDRPSPGHYDLMASEARLTSFIACARGDVPVRHWQALSRARLALDGWRGLASWSGSMFEYLMPELFLPLVNGSMLWETGRFCLYAQRERARRARTPWGSSESAFFSLDAGMDYRYKAHGVGALALRRDVDGEVVVAPYASFLALAVHPKAAVENLRRLKGMGMWGRYGFYEALDLTPGRAGKKGQVVACFMSHHLGMSLAAAANCLNGGALRRYFMSWPAFAAFRPLLAERVPLSGAVLRRGRSPLTRPPEGRPDMPAFRREGQGHVPSSPAWFPMSNGVYSLLACDDGRCRAACGGLVMYREEGFAVSVDGIPAGPSRREGTLCPWRYEAGTVTFTARRADRVTGLTLAVASGERGELRRLTGPSGGKVTVRFEPVLAPAADHAAHPAFWRLGLEVSVHRGAVLVRRLSRGAVPECWLCLAATAPLRLEEGGGWQTLGPVLIRAQLPEGGCAAMALCFGETAALAEEGARRILLGGTADMAGSMAALLGMGEDGLAAAFDLAADVCSPRVAARPDATRGALWKQGLSGELPIVYVDASESLDAAKRMIKRHALVTACGAAFDLAIHTGEDGAYLHPRQDELRRYLDKYGLAAFEGARGGVRFTGGGDVAAAAVLLSRPDRRYSPLPAWRALPVRGRTAPEVTYLAGGAVSYMTPPLPPRAWCNVLTNGRFGYLAADCGGGFMWMDNARERPVDPWRNDPAAAGGGETLELVTAQGRRSLFAGDGPCRVSNGFGWTRWEREDAALTAFVPRGYDVRVMIVEGGEGAYIGWYLPLALTPERADIPCVITGVEDGCLTAVNPRSAAPEQVFRAVCSRKLAGFTGDEAAWLAGRMDGRTGAGLRPCFGALWKGGGVSVLVCGYESAETLRSLAQPERAAKELVRVRDGWRSLLGRVRIHTPDQALDRMMNGWAAYQTLACRIMARTSMYQSGGAWGFRDQLQDTVDLLLIAPERAGRHILTCCARQFREGDVLHWWHETPAGPKGVRTRCSDDLIWLPWAVCEYVEKTGDEALCQRTAPWLEAPPLAAEERDRYFEPALSREESAVLDHARQALECVLARGCGPHGLLRTGSGDWNDGMDKVDGESQWLTWFFLHTAGRFAALLDRLGQDGRRYAQAADALAAAAERSWDGQWYLRGWWADGAPLGGAGAPACQIDSIAQSWAAFCPQADRERVHTALRAAVDRLYDRAHKLVKLFAPPFGDGGRDPGYIRSCGPGIRENGGQYTHGAVWLASALLREGFTDAGAAMLLDLLPAAHPPAQWGAEPWVLAADVSADPDHYGQALWSWYTGSAGWFFRVVLEDLLGIRLENGRITVRPKLPAGWDGYEADICGRRIVVRDGKVTIR